MQVVDMDKLGRAKHFEWFNQFQNPTFSINVRIDVSNIRTHAKNHGKSFFIEMLYLVTEALHSVDEMRMRIKGDDVVIFDMINPAYTIMTDAGVFENSRHTMSHDYETFYTRAAENIAIAKSKRSHDDNSNDNFNDLSIIDEFYITSIPWVDMLSVTHPQPTWSKENMSIPRVCWGKYIEQNGRYSLALNLTANHALVDGKPLSIVAVNLQTMIDKIDVESSALVGWK